MKVFCGIDWSERHHDVALVDQDGTLIAKRGIGESVEDFTELLTLLAEAGDNAEEPIPVAIETSRGLLVAALRATGRPSCAINPMGVARYRERHCVSRKKSDHADAMTLANILRTDAHAHRRLPADSELAQAITVLARAAQDAIWRRSKAIQELRALLREFYPGFLAAFAHGSVTNLASPEARAILAIAPTPASGARPSQAPPGSAPVTRASGRSLSITRRRIKNDRLNAVDSSGPSPPCPDPDHPKTTTTADEPTVIDTPPPYDTCSTACSASSTTASTPDKPTTRSKHSANQQRPTKRQLDFLARSEVYRDTPTRSGGSKHHPKPQPTDQRQGISASCIAGQTTTWDGTSAIFTVKPSSEAAHADPHSCIKRRLTGAGPAGGVEAGLQALGRPVCHASRTLLRCRASCFRTW